MRLSVKQRVGLALGLMAAATVVGAGVWWQSTRLPNRFAAVVDGRLYRSGRVSPAQLERLQRQYGIRRVISLLDADDPATVAERQAAGRLGIDWHNVPLTGDGASTAAERDRIRRLLANPDAPPTLVHCAAGVNRTGLAVGLYRLHCQHWTLEQVLAEMRAFGFDDLPRHENLRQALAAEAEAAAASRD
jgi:protein tyrosine/serine phosphatase